jgi:hypothetical protein
VFICVKKYVACVELWADENFEMKAVEMKGRDAKLNGKSQASTELRMRA